MNTVGHAIAHRRPDESRGPGVGDGYRLNARYRRIPTLPIAPHRCAYCGNPEDVWQQVHDHRRAAHIPALGYPRSGSGTTSVATTFPSSPRDRQDPSLPIVSPAQAGAWGVLSPSRLYGRRSFESRPSGRSAERSGIERFLAVPPDDALYDFAGVRRT